MTSTPLGGVIASVADPETPTPLLTLAEAIQETSTEERLITAEVLADFVDEKTKFFEDSVIGIVDTLPTAGLTDGDRYALRGTPPTIQEFRGLAFNAIALPDGGQFTVLATNEQWQRLGDELVRTNEADSAPYFTQLISGGNTALASGTTFTLVATKYREFNGDRATPAWQEYDIAAQTVTVPSGILAVDGEKHVYLENGAIAYSTTYPSNANLNKRVYLAVLVVSGGAIALVIPQLLEQNPYNETTDLLFVGGIVNKSVEILPNAGTMTVRSTAGIFDITGRNYFTDPDSPHTVNLAESNPLTYDLYLPDGTQIGASLTDWDFTQYSNGGVATDSPGTNDATTRHVYFCPNRVGNQWVAVLDTIFYTTINVAKQRWQSENQHQRPTFLGDQIFLVAVLLGRTGATDISNIAQAAITTPDTFSSSGVTSEIYEGTNLSGADFNIHKIAIVTNFPAQPQDGIYRPDNNGNWIN